MWDVKQYFKIKILYLLFKIYPIGIIYRFIIYVMYM